jgi:hypothetical protein
MRDKIFPVECQHLDIAVSDFFVCDVQNGDVELSVERWPRLLMGLSLSW